VFFDEVAALHLVEHVEPLQNPIRFRDQRLTNVKPREVVALEYRHTSTLLSEPGRDHGAPRTATQHNHLWGAERFTHHAAYSTGFGGGPSWIRSPMYAPMSVKSTPIAAMMT